MVVASNLDTNASLAPVSPLGVVTAVSLVIALPCPFSSFAAAFAPPLSCHGNIVPDGVASPKADPLRNWAVLLLRLCELLLGAEGLVGLCRR